MQDIHIHRAISCTQQIDQSLVVSCTLENFGVVKFSCNLTSSTKIVSTNTVSLLHSVCHCLCVLCNKCLLSRTSVCKTIVKLANVQFMFHFFHCQAHCVCVCVCVCDSSHNIMCALVHMHSIHVCSGGSSNGAQWAWAPPFQLPKY